MNSKRWVSFGMCLFVVVLASGCSGPTTAIKYGVKIVGKVVDEAQMSEYEEKLVGQPPSAADAEFGERKDVLRDTRSERLWLVYGVKIDPLDKNRIVVEVNKDKILAISKVEKGGSKIDIPRKLILKEKLEGKQAAAVQQELDMGPPLLTVQRDSDASLIQLYDAAMVKELQKHSWCLVRYDTSGVFAEIEFIEAGSGTEDSRL